MKIAGKILSIALVAIGAILGVWFYLENNHMVTVIWFGHPVENLQLALWLLLFFAAGTLLGLTVSAFQSIRHQMHMQVLRNQLKAIKQKSVTTQGKP